MKKEREIIMKKIHENNQKEDKENQIFKKKILQDKANIIQDLAINLDRNFEEEGNK